MAAVSASPVDAGGMRFLITDRPPAEGTANFLQVLQRHGVTALVRVADASYDAAPVVAAGIAVHDWPYPDGTNPPADIIGGWLELCAREAEVGGRIAVHCVAGLGRAPVMVALALIERGMAAEDAVLFIRKQRRGAINTKQLQFLQQHRPARKKRGGLFARLSKGSRK